MSREIWVMERVVAVFTPAMHVGEERRQYARLACGDAEPLLSSGPAPQRMRCSRCSARELLAQQPRKRAA